MFLNGSLRRNSSGSFLSAFVDVQELVRNTKEFNRNYLGMWSSSIVARHGCSKFGSAFGNARKAATPRLALRNLRTLVTMKSRDDYRLLRLTEPQKAIFGPDNASKHIRTVSKHPYIDVRCVWSVVGSFPGVQTAQNGQKRSNVTLT